MKKVICDDCEQETEDYEVDMFGFISCKSCSDYWKEFDKKRKENKENDN